MTNQIEGPFFFGTPCTHHGWDCQLIPKGSRNVAQQLKNHVNLCTVLDQLHFCTKKQKRLKSQWKWNFDSFFFFFLKKWSSLNDCFEGVKLNFVIYLAFHRCLKKRKRRRKLIVNLYNVFCNVCVNIFKTLYYTIYSLAKWMSNPSC